MNEDLKPNATPFPALFTLPALQDYVQKMVANRGFTKDLNEIFILLTEEVGELAREFKNRVYYPARYSPENLAHELADITLYLLDLANVFGVDLEALWPAHELALDERFAKRRKGQPPKHHFTPGMTLNQLVAHVEAKRKERAFEDKQDMLLILLTEELGELANELRKHWKGKGVTRETGFEMIDALTYVFRLGLSFGVDMEKALVEKETKNRERQWDD